jgi:hypothetical protein
MKITVFADSHSDVDTMSVVIEVENPDMVIHLGDHVTDGAELEALFPDIPMELVKGNTDRTDEYLSERILLLNDKLIFVTHGDQYGVEQGISEIPSQSRLAEAVLDVLEWWRQDSADWEMAVDKVYEKYGYYHPVHTINNALLVCIGLLYGQLDFGKSVGIAVSAALDTDCNGATVGSIVGLVLGAKGLPQEWIAPLCDTIETGVHGYNLVPISRLAQDTAKLCV